MSQAYSGEARLVRGARVSKRSEIGQMLERAQQPAEVVDFYDIRSKAYVLAKASEHKPWAKRWLRQQRYR